MKTMYAGMTKDDETRVMRAIQRLKQKREGEAVVIRFDQADPINVRNLAERYSRKQGIEPLVDDLDGGIQVTHGGLPLGKYHLIDKLEVGDSNFYAVPKHQFAAIRAAAVSRHANGRKRFRCEADVGGIRVTRVPLDLGDDAPTPGLAEALSRKPRFDLSALEARPVVHLALRPEDFGSARVAVSQKKLATGWELTARTTPTGISVYRLDLIDKMAQRMPTLERLADEYDALIHHMNAGGSFDAFQLARSEEFDQAQRDLAA